MIKPGEIQKKARETGVRDQQIEKDYVLSWILRGISQHGALSKKIVFKGDTVLKKFYFIDYRFSEDLDFTQLDNDSDTDQILSWFKEAFEYVKKEANIPLAIIDYNEHGGGGINFHIRYTGPLGGLGSNKSVKVDISRSEQLAYNPVLMPAIITYSDIDDHELLCYPIEEVLVEKLRSVLQRMQARDFYDIWYLLEQHDMEASFHMKEFAMKCASKGLSHLDFSRKLSERLPLYKARWESSLKEQIRNLPDFEQVEREVQKKLKIFKSLP